MKKVFPYGKPQLQKIYEVFLLFLASINILFALIVP